MALKLKVLVKEGNHVVMIEEGVMTAEVVVTGEAAVPQAGAGAQKLGLVLSAVEGAAKMAPGLVADGQKVATAAGTANIPDLVTGLTHIVGSTVGFFNAVGAFQKSGVVQAINASGIVPPADGSSGGA